jgi:alkylation response protein AidB-like acyl-CoA dehydrogenase
VVAPTRFSAISSPPSASACPGLPADACSPLAHPSPARGADLRRLSLIKLIKERFPVDFSLSEEQQAIADLSRQILADQVTPERLKEVESSPELIDRRTWRELAQANLLGVALAEADGGSGQGFLSACIICQEIGRTVAPVPFLASIIMAALPIAEFGSNEQKRRLLPGAIAGEAILTAALVEVGTDAAHPEVQASPTVEGWRLDGMKICVPAATVADWFLVPARTGAGEVGAFLVPAGAAGVTVVAEETTNRQAEGRLELAGVDVPTTDVLGDPSQGRAIAEWIVERSTAALSMTAAGLCETAVRMTADYTKTREQFDRPIAMFQAVSQRAADAYIDAEAVRLTAWQAAWRLDAGLPASAEVAVAKFWASEGGQRVVHAAQHLHGGIGVDRDYPLHRYFLWAKHIELTLGGATAQLLRLGSLLAGEPAEPGRLGGRQGP